MMQYMYSYYTNSTKKNVISVWTFSKEVKLVQCMSCSFHCSWYFSSLIDAFQSMLVICTSTSRGIPAQKISGGDFYFYFNKQGGSESLSIHCPTKTVVRVCDIFGGRFEDVPAISHMTW